MATGGGKVGADAKEIGAILLFLALLVVVLVTVFGVAGDIAGPQEQTIEYPTEDVAESLDASFRIGDGTDVLATTGSALALDSTDADATTAGTNWTDSAWTMAVTGRLNTTEPNATDVARTAATADNGSIEILYNRTEWVAVYDNGSQNATVTVADANAGDLEPVVARYNGSHLRLDANGSTAAAALDTQPITPPMEFDWQGTLDELRVFNSTLSDTNTTAYETDPIQPLPDTDRVARYMFDQGEGSTTFAYFANETVDIGAAGWTDGVADPGLSDGTDYSLNDEPASVVVAGSGYLASAPVVHVQNAASAFGGILSLAGNIGASAITIVALGVLILAGGRVLGYFDEF